MQSMQNLKRGINKMKKKLLEILAEVCDEDALAETDDMDIDLVAEDLIDSMGLSLIHISEPTRPY